jgi:hypothetical protein
LILLFFYPVFILFLSFILLSALTPVNDINSSVDLITINSEPVVIDEEELLQKLIFLEQSIQIFEDNDIVNQCSTSKSTLDDDEEKLLKTIKFLEKTIYEYEEVRNNPNPKQQSRVMPFIVNFFPVAMMLISRYLKIILASKKKKITITKMLFFNFTFNC